MESGQWSYDGRLAYISADAALPEGQAARTWSPVPLARPATLPADFATFRTTPGRVTSGQIVTTKGGATVYVFGCQEDGPDRLDCDDPEDNSPLWTTLCGSLDRCASLFKPVIPSARSKPDGRVWSIVTIAAPWAHGARRKGVAAFGSGPIAVDSVHVCPASEAREYGRRDRLPGTRMDGDRGARVLINGLDRQWTDEFVR